MPNLFNSVKLTKPKKNVFDLSHDVKMSFNMGELIPTMCMECIPGDKFNIGCESLLRFQPLVSPMMHRCDVSMHYFFVPNRILWLNWENWITNTKVVGPDTLPEFPFINLQGLNSITPNYTRLCDYLGLPSGEGLTDTGGAEKISALPFAAYQKIYDEYYRDQNLITPIFGVNGLLGDGLSDGNNDARFADTLSILRRRAWEHDYFTAALPFAQKGDAVQIPIGSQLVVYDDTQVGIEGLVRDPADGSLLPTEDLGTGAAGELRGLTSVTDAVYDPNGTLITEDSGESTTINDLRRAFKLQEWLEKAARGGSRYVEMIKSMFGVQSSDKRLNRPEYITGTKSPVIISEVLNTTGTEDAPQGNMAGHAVSVTQGKYGGYFCEEHGYIIGIMSVMPKTAYSQGIPKHFLKINDPFELYWEQFAHIGEQAIDRRELTAYMVTARGNDPFGYIPRYAEYKFMNNRIAGDFRTTLDTWHMARQFAYELDGTPGPTLNQAFVECDPTHRVFAVTDPEVQKMLCHVYHKIKALRPMPKFGTPTF